MNRKPLQYDWFSPEDFNRIAALISRDPESHRFIIVGGQSLVGWALTLDIDLPKTATPYLTQDLDLFCTQADAQWLADQLGAELRAPTLDDATCQSGKLLFQPGSDRGWLIIDFLQAIIGPSNEQVKAMAVPISYNGRQLHLLHPLLCLHSRLANLHALPEKRSGNGVAQAYVAIEIVKRYLESLPPSPLLLKSVRRLLQIAFSIEGIRCHKEWGIDPLAAINPKIFADNTRPLGKYRYQKLLRRVIYKREIASQGREGVHQARDMRAADQYVLGQSRKILAEWGLPERDTPIGMSFKSPNLPK